MTTEQTETAISTQGKTITKVDYNHLVDLYNRRSKFDVIGVQEEEHRALGSALDILRGRLSPDDSLVLP